MNSPKKWSNKPFKSQFNRYLIRKQLHPNLARQDQDRETQVFSLKITESNLNQLNQDNLTL